MFSGNSWISFSNGFRNWKYIMTMMLTLSAEHLSTLHLKSYLNKVMENQSIGGLWEFSFMKWIMVNLVLFRYWSLHCQWPDADLLKYLVWQTEIFDRFWPGCQIAGQTSFGTRFVQEIRELEKRYKLIISGVEDIK